MGICLEWNLANEIFDYSLPLIYMLLKRRLEKHPSQLVHKVSWQRGNRDIMVLNVKGSALTIRGTAH